MPLELVHRKWTANWVIRGIRVEESTGTSNQRAAEEIKAKREAEILEESIHGRRATSTFAHAAVSYMEAGGSKRFLEPIIKLYNTTPLGQINQDAIDRGARKVYPEASDATRNRQFYTPVSAVLTHAARRGWCSLLPLERPPQAPGRTEWLKVDQANRLVAECGHHLRPFVIFLLSTGARCGEALWLDWRNVDLQRAQVTFPKTKNGDVRSVPLHECVVAALANLPHREGEVFRRPDGQPYARPADGDLSDTSAGARIKKAFKGACKRAGIESFTPHGCRHTWASWHYIRHRDLTALMALGGWKTPTQVFRYAHTNVEQHKISIDALPFLGGGDSGSAATGEARSA